MTRPDIRRSGHFNGAFTLVELLVVIAIVVILAAVLFPVFAQARQNRAASCMSNHRRLAEAAELYALDHNGRCLLQSPSQLNGYLGTQGLSACPSGFIAGAPRFIHERGYAGHGHGGSPNMVWHNGAIMPTTATATIFWGTKWDSTNPANSAFIADKIDGLDTWYNGFGASNYAATSDEYTGTNGTVTSTVSYDIHYIDKSAAPSGAPSTSQILNEVCKVIPASKLSANGYYAVYVDTKRGSAGYCAWHSYGSCSGVPVQIAFFFNLDGDSGCDPQDASGLHSQGLAALANVSGHELSEARTDPRNGGWYDASGAENGDKCAWTYNVPLVTFADPMGTKWKIQGEWSNNAYNTGTGYANSSGQKGCLSGN